MNGYYPVQGKPQWAPAHAGPPKRAAFLGAPSRLGQQTSERSALGSVLSLGLAGATAYVGIHTGIKSTGFLSVLGWVVGLAGAASGVIIVSEVADQIGVRG